MMSSFPLSICICSTVTTDDAVIAHCDRNHSNETTDSVHTPVKIFYPFDSHRPGGKETSTSLIWNHSYHLKMLLLKLIPHFTQFTSNLNLHANSHVTFVVFFFCSPFVGLPFFDVLYAIRDRLEQRGEVCTKSSISYKIKTIFFILYTIKIVITIDML